MIPAIIVVALLALAGFLFWLAVRHGGFPEWVVAACVLGFGMYGAQAVLA